MSNNKQIENITQHEMFETAQKRIKQKKRLFQHFVLFVLGCLFMYIINKLLDYGAEYNWYLWGILAWGFIFLLNFINVFVTNRFLSKDWERKQREKLVALQEKKMMKMQAQIEKEYAKMAEKVAKEESKKPISEPKIITPDKDNLPPANPEIDSQTSKI